MSHDPDFRNPGPLKDVHHGNKFLHGQLLVRADDYSRRGVLCMKGEQAGFQIGRGDNFAIQLDRIIFIDRDRHDFSGIDAPFCGRAGGHDEIHAVLDQRRCDHENNEQHERKVEKRRHVELGQRLQTVSRGIASHVGS